MRTVIRQSGDFIDAVPVGEADRDLSLGRREIVNAHQAVNRNWLLLVGITDKNSHLGTFVVEILGNQMSVHGCHQQWQRRHQIGMGNAERNTLFPGIIGINFGSLDYRLTQIFLIFRIIQNKVVIL